MRDMKDTCGWPSQTRFWLELATSQPRNPPEMDLRLTRR